jgi:flagellin
MIPGISELPGDRMSFTINTNVTSLQAQNYLTQSSNFQAQTINEVTSGLRIVNSGDDAAGLAVANGLASDQAVLTQGIQNANNGLSTLQTIDGGMGNINTLLDRAQTLATESASGTFTGSRATLNTEFQSVLTEIDRQSTAIGMNQGGTFAKALTVFIGGGQGTSAAATSANGTINVDLSKSTVDTKSLGLQGTQVTAAAGTNLSASSATSVASILADTTNTASEAVAGTTKFSFSGAGFSGANAVNVSVNTTGVTDVTTLAAAVNAAIQGAGNGGTTADTAFKNTAVTASVYTDANGKQSLAFNSTGAFTATGLDQTANALMGNFNNQATLAGTATAAVVDTSVNKTLTLTFDGGSAATYTLTGNAATTTTTVAQIAANLNSQASFSALGTATVDSANHLIIQSNKTGLTSQVALTSTTLATTLGLSATPATITDVVAGKQVAGTVTGAASLSGASGATAGNIIVRFQGSGLASPVDIKLAVTGGTTTDAAVIAALASAVSTNSQLAAAGIKIGASTAGAALTFTNSSNQLFSVSAAGDNTNILGLGAWQLANQSTATSQDYTAITSTVATTAGTTALNFSAGGGASFNIWGALLGTAADAVTLNAAFALSAQATAAGLQATISGAFKLTITSTNGTNFRLNDTTAFSGFSAGTVTGAAANISTATAPQSNIYTSGGDQATAALSFTAITNGGDSQTVAITSNDANGAAHTTSVVLGNSATVKNGGSIDAAINAINTQLQQTNDSTLQGIVAVKQEVNGQETIGFQGAQAFQVTSGTTSSGAGVGSQGLSTVSALAAGGGTSDISTVAGAESAIGALNLAVASFGTAQAAVGRGENDLNYAINLAQSQNTNEAAAEANIKDANLAMEAANLSKAQVLVQAGVAALAQANSAPQALLKLLQ